MDAQKRVTCTLRVEWLESRCLLASASSITPLEPHAQNPSAPARDAAQITHVGAPLAAPAANATQTASQYTPDGDDDDGDDQTASTPAGHTVEDSHPGGRVQLLNSDTIEQYPDGRERETENHTVPQLAHNDSRTPTPTNQLAAIPANQIAVPVAFGAASTGSNEDHPERTAHALGELVSVALTPSTTGVNEERIVDASNAPALSGPAFSCVPLAPAGSVPAPAGDRVIPGASASEDEPIIPSLRSVLLDPLAGIPLNGTVALNLAKLGAETGAFFEQIEQLTNLGTEWTISAEWTEYVCFAAGVLLVGGAYFARSAWAHRTPPPVRVRFEPHEGAR
jgi:hypothetical protein